MLRGVTDAKENPDKEKRKKEYFQWCCAHPIDIQQYYHHHNRYCGECYFMVQLRHHGIQRVTEKHSLCRPNDG